MTSDGAMDFHVPDEAPETVDLVSRVTNAEGEGLEGIVVRGEPLGRGASWSEVTLADGTFSSRVPLGTYRVEFEPPELSDLEARHLTSVDIPCGFPSVLTLTPRIEAGAPPSAIVSLSNSPNPWRGSTRITLALSGSENEAALDVYDLMGRRV
jgi:hypothetical protein